jgi:Arc/MetJ family transcription regulator
MVGLCAYNQESFCLNAQKSASFDDIPGEKIMRTTVVLDDELLEKAQALTNVQEKSSLIREALKALIERESAKRLASLGGSEPQLLAISRRQSLTQVHDDLS